MDSFHCAAGAPGGRLVDHYQETIFEIDAEECLRVCNAFDLAN
jgi:hypothetical protein